MRIRHWVISRMLSNSTRRPRTNGVSLQHITSSVIYICVRVRPGPPSIIIDRLMTLSWASSLRKKQKRALLATPQVLLTDKRQALRRALEDKGLRSVVLFVDLLLRKKRLSEFETIVHEFESLVEKQQGIRRAQVVSAIPLTGAELDRLHTKLEEITGSRIRLASATDPDLIGGALVRIGNRVIDRSVRTLLEAIEQQLSETAV